MNKMNLIPALDSLSTELAESRQRESLGPLGRFWLMRKFLIS